VSLSGPLFIVGVLLGMAVLLQVLRRWTGLMAWLAAATAGGIAALVSVVLPDSTLTLGRLSVTLGEPLVILGRQLVIQSVDRLPLVFIGTTSALLFIVAWRLLPHSNFFPAGLAAMAMLSAALMVSQVVYAALLVEIAALIMIFPLHEPITTADGTSYGGAPRGGVQYLVYASLALPGLMVAQLLLEQFAVFPSDQGLLQTATVLLGLSLAVLLGAVPFQAWLSSVAEEGAPPVVTFIFTANLGTVWFLLLAYLESYSWLSQQASFTTILTIVGLIMMAVGGILAASQNRLGRMVGYATLVDNGALFVALGSGRIAGLSLTIVLLMARPLALALMTLGLDGLRRIGHGSDGLEDLKGAAWAVPWRTLAFVIGGVAMAGFPLSLGFYARWGLYRLLAQANLFQAVLGLAGSAGVMMGLINAVRVLLAPSEMKGTRSAVTEDRVVLALIVALMAVALGLGLFPQMASREALQMAEGFTFFSG